MNDFKESTLVKPEFLKNSAALNLVFNEKVKAMIKSKINIAHFAFGQSPFPIPRCLTEELKNFAHMNSYLPITGIPELRNALSSFHKRYDNLDLDPKNFIVAPGSKELIYLIMYTFNGTLLLPSPSWTTYMSQCRLAGKQPLILQTEENFGWKVTTKAIIDALEQTGTRIKKEFKLLILTNPGNPTGTCYTERELQDLTVFCRDNKILILSDEIYSRLTFNGVHHSPLKFYPEGVIMTNGFSKWASAGGWRLGYTYIPSSMNALYQAVLNSASHTYSCAPAPMQYAAAQALSDYGNELDEYINNCRAILKLVGDYCYRELASVGVTGNMSEAGFYYMANFEVIRKGLLKKGIETSAEMTEAMMKEANVALMDCTSFLRPNTELTTRFCFVCFDGSKALDAFVFEQRRSGELTASNEAGRLFVKTHCPTLTDGVDRLVRWVEKCSNFEK